MNTIKINVGKQIDGFSFSITPSVRKQIKTLFPTANPANNIFVGYDTKSNFDIYIGRLESHIYPALFGVDNESDLNQFGEIQFVEAQTGKVLYKLTPSDEKV